MTTLEAVEAFICKRRSVSFVDLEKFVEAELGVPVKGDREIVFEEANVVLWAGVNAEFCNLIHRMKEGDQVEATPTELLVYLVDGKCLTYPLAKRPPKAGYKEPHWLPVVFNPKKGLLK